MRRFMVRSVVAILVALTWGLNSVWAADAPPKARYPALAYVAAVLIILIVVAIVAFPSRKETWDQRVEKRHGRNP
ncbi:MAG TPA: hypothetical protein VGX70_19960 [Gemmataceae bacterium]|nr:hypothetical protein [Gemmataceae bacterium]